MQNELYFKTQLDKFRSDTKFPLRVKIEKPQTVTVSHQHEFCECIFVIAGHGMHQSGKNKSVPIRRGDVLFIPIGGHHAYTEANGLSVINLLFDSSKLPPVLMELYSNAVYKQIFLKKHKQTDTGDFPATYLSDEIFSELETMLNYFAFTDMQSEKHCYQLGLFMAIISKLCVAWKLNSAEPFQSLDIPKLTAYMANNFQQQIYLEDLTRLSNMSKATLLRHFRAAFGITPMIYLRNLRLRHAAELLLKTELSLKEIADQSGFLQMPYFFKTFKSYYEVSPLDYRKKK